MATYVILLSWTDQGMKGFKETVDRYESARDAGSAAGVTWKDVHWTMGPYDIVATVEAPDDEAAMAMILNVAGQGNIRSTTMRAFSADEMRAVIEKTA